MNFDEKIERRGTHSDKWDMMESKYGASPKDGIPMWVADMDFRPPDCVQKAVETGNPGEIENRALAAASCLIQYVEGRRRLEICKSGIQRNPKHENPQTTFNSRSRRGATKR